MLWIYLSLMANYWIGLFPPPEANLLMKPNSKHEFHTSLTEMDYNVQKQRFEVSLRVFADDFESAIRDHSQDVKLVLDGSDKFKPLIQSYLNQHFQVINLEKKRLALKYMGMEPEQDGFWLFMIIPCQSIQPGYTFRNSVLVDLFDDQVNLVNIRYRDLKTTLMFLKGKTLLDFPSK